MTERAKLIEQLEKLKAADRATDWQIHCRNGLLGVGHYGPHPAYTSSIDAAITLVPKDGPYIWSWRVGNTPSGRGFSYIGTSQIEHEGASPAIALCIAALKAAS